MNGCPSPVRAIAASSPPNDSRSGRRRVWYFGKQAGKCLIDGTVIVIRRQLPDCLPVLPPQRGIARIIIQSPRHRPDHLNVGRVDPLKPAQTAQLLQRLLNLAAVRRPHAAPVTHRHNPEKVEQ
jgi:hypothetical protein